VANLYCHHPGCQHVGTNLQSLGRDQRGDPSETLQALTCHPAVVIFVVLSAMLGGCHLPKSDNQPWTVSMRG